jgi:hypothetical protein
VCTARLQERQVCNSSYGNISSRHTTHGPSMASGSGQVLSRRICRCNAVNFEGIICTPDSSIEPVLEPTLEPVLVYGSA